MRYEWPWVSRKVHDELRRELNEARLDLSIANSTVHHLTDCRMDHIKRLANAAMTIARLQNDVKALRHELEYQGTPV